MAAALGAPLAIVECITVRASWISVGPSTSNSQHLDHNSRFVASCSPSYLKYWTALAIASVGAKLATVATNLSS